MQLFVVGGTLSGWQPLWAGGGAGVQLFGGWWTQPHLRLSFPVSRASSMRSWMASMVCDGHQAVLGVVVVTAARRQSGGRSTTVRSASVRSGAPSKVSATGCKGLKSKLNSGRPTGCASLPFPTGSAVKPAPAGRPCWARLKPQALGGGFKSNVPDFAESVCQLVPLPLPERQPYQRHAECRGPAIRVSFLRSGRPTVPSLRHQPWEPSPSKEAHFAHRPRARPGDSGGRVGA